MAASINVRYQCPRCQAQCVSGHVDAGTTLSCGMCEWSRVVAAGELSGTSPRHCLVCGNEDLWQQKDFPQALGMAFVGVGAVGSSVAWFYHWPVTALAILLGFAAIDFALFAIMPDVLVCYRCSARHRGGDIAEHPVFDHETAERYRQQQMRLDESQDNPQAR